VLQAHGVHNNKALRHLPGLRLLWWASRCQPPLQLLLLLLLLLLELLAFAAGPARLRSSNSPLKSCITVDATPPMFLTAAAMANFARLLALQVEHQPLLQQHALTSPHTPPAPAWAGEPLSAALAAAPGPARPSSSSSPPKSCTTASGAGRCSGHTSCGLRCTYTPRRPACRQQQQRQVAAASLRRHVNTPRRPVFTRRMPAESPSHRCQRLTERWSMHAASGKCVAPNAHKTEADVCHCQCSEQPCYDLMRVALHIHAAQAGLQDNTSRFAQPLLSIGYTLLQSTHAAASGDCAASNAHYTKPAASKVCHRATLPSTAAAPAWLLRCPRGGWPPCTPALLTPLAASPQTGSWRRRASTPEGEQQQRHVCDKP
jgi:hypothetical protein